jgi:hypothetical protein
MQILDPRSDFPVSAPTTASSITQHDLADLYIASWARRDAEQRYREVRDMILDKIDAGDAVQSGPFGLHFDHLSMRQLTHNGIMALRRQAACARISEHMPEASRRMTVSLVTLPVTSNDEPADPRSRAMPSPAQEQN